MTRLFLTTKFVYHVIYYQFAEDLVFINGGVISETKR